MPKFFLPATAGAAGETVHFTQEDAWHIARVLRLAPGTEVRAGDGRGYAYRVLLRTVTPQLVAGEILAKEADESEPALRIHLYQSLLKGEKMDWVLQKGTEIGVFSFQPFLSSRSVARPEPAQAGKKQQRWSRIALEAAKQSERGVIPTVHPLATIDSLPWPAGVPALVAWEGEQEKSLRQVLAAMPKPEELILVVGPEGGFAREEVEFFVDRGALPVSLGPRILRAETAGPVTAALILYHYGEM
ncbi:MAG: 16S rRNA (uracil(1498)-N(3))-methyltransferase [Firmicutes bacterium]|jgi:16S rRNA (uracil1498-N3)-methyltransferase|nr:16S rRNA (uracil(1498)-N(3))-methyltransferase [Bacillota bacterium]